MKEVSQNAAMFFNNIKSESSFQHTFIPYLVESKVKKMIFSFLRSLPNVFTTKSGKRIDINSFDWVDAIEGKIARMNLIELKLFQEEIMDRGEAWGVNYLFGGIRNDDHLCRSEPRSSEDIRPDNFLQYQGISIF